MEKVDRMLLALAPEIDAKCAQIRQKKSERILTRIFAASALWMLVFPALLIFLGVSIAAILMPILFIGTVCLIALPIFMRKGDAGYESI